MINPKGFDVYIMQLNSIRKAYIYRNVLQFIFSLKLLHLLWFCCYKKKHPKIPNENLYFTAFENMCLLYPPYH